jgi:hypothetical protein
VTWFGGVDERVAGRDAGDEPQAGGEKSMTMVAGAAGGR